jgi:HAD superfamily hydrolase (TIGR01549 family)
MKYRAVIFDLDDTLLKTYSIKWEQHKATAKRFYNKTLSDEMIRLHWGKLTRDLVSAYYGTDDTTQNMVANYRSLDNEYLKELHDDSIRVLNYLSRPKVFTGLVTNATRETVLADLARLGVALDLFNLIQTFDDTQAYKPDPKVFEIMLHTLARNGIRDHILYVGDDITDYHAASIATIHFIGVTTGVRTREDFEREGVKMVISTLSELPKLLA